MPLTDVRMQTSGATTHSSVNTEVLVETTGVHVDVHRIPFFSPLAVGRVSPGGGPAHTALRWFAADAYRGFGAIPTAARGRRPRRQAARPPRAWTRVNEGGLIERVTQNCFGGLFMRTPSGR